MKYGHGVSVHRQKRFRKRAYMTFVGIFFIFLVVAAVIKIDSYLQERRNSPESTTSAQTTSYFTPSTQIFRTPYFQFQANKNWAEVPAESSENTFVYRSLRSNLVEHDLTIYVGGAPNVPATHVLPVRLKNDMREITPGMVSEHCKKAVGHRLPEKMLTFEGISFLCDVDSPQYMVLAGIKGGSSQLKMKRPNGQAQNYTILYRNVTAEPETSQFLEILSSFQTR